LKPQVLDIAHEGDSTVAEIQTGASYVRQSPRPNGTDDRQILSSIEKTQTRWPTETTLAVWSLLQTPQTVESVARVLSQGGSAEGEHCIGEVKAVFAQWVDADLIQLSPDS
jgi:hypothetical protein